MEFLLAVEDFDVNAKDDNLVTALHIACSRDDATLMEDLLSSDKIDVNAKDKNGVTPLLSVCGWSLERTKLLLKNRHINVNASGTMNGISNITPLHWAYIKNEMDIVQILLDVPDIDINAVDGNNMTPKDYLGRQLRKAKKRAYP